MSVKFYKCNTCGNIVVKYCDSGAPLTCCGEQMTELVPQSEDGFAEKHVPEIECPDMCTIKVRVGSKPHPMTEKHMIQFIYVETEGGGMLRFLHPEDKPEAVFWTCADRPVAVYEYCNIHGLWWKQLKKKCIKDKL